MLPGSVLHKIKQTLEHNMIIDNKKNYKDVGQCCTEKA
jgi:hypothetical protein